jgi:hypothetical protein
VLRVIDDNSYPYKSMMMNAIRINKGYLGECSSVDEPNENTTRVFLTFEKFQIIITGWVHKSQ